MYKKTYPLVGLLVVIVIAIAAGLLELFHPELMVLGVVAGMIVLGVQVYMSRKETADIARALEKHIAEDDSEAVAVVVLASVSFGFALLGLIGIICS